MFNTSNYLLNVTQTAVVSAKQVLLTYIYRRMSFYWRLCVLRIFACLCGIKSEY